MSNKKQPDSPKDDTPKNNNSKNDGPKPVKSQKSKSKKRHLNYVTKYVLVGITLTVINFTIYTFLDRVVFNNINLLWLVSLISCTITTFFGYLLHSKITWRERNPGKTGAIKFLAWNLFASLAVSPFFTWLFGFITPLYQFAYNISSYIHLPFDYDFIESTAIFCLTAFVVMILNFLFYDRIVFKPKENHANKSSR